MIRQEFFIGQFIFTNKRIIPSVMTAYSAASRTSVDGYQRQAGPLKGGNPFLLVSLQRFICFPPGKRQTNI